MIDLGIVRPGSTIRIPFSSFDKDDGSSITMTNYAAADILVYKDGSTTGRASTAGFTATTDFDTKTGKHLAIIDLAENTTAGFWSSGSEYLVAIDAVTVDAVTTGGWIARFTIGYVNALLNTTIATLASQTSFTLTAGPAEDDALNGMWALIHDVASAVQCGQAIISDYTGATKTVTLAAGTTFTAAATDNISVMGPMPIQPTVSGRTLDVTSTGAAGIDLANVENQGTTLGLTATTIAAVTTTATATNLTNLPAITANWLTAAGIAAGALDGKGNWNIGKTGYTLTVTTGLGNQTADITGNLSGSVGSVTGAVGSVTGAVGSVTGLTAATVHAELDDIQARLPAALIGGRIDANLGAISTSATAADNLERSTLGIVTGTVGAASTTTSIVTSALSPAAAVIDQYKGRIVTFDSATTTANLRGQSTDITTNTALGVLTVTALTTAPASGDTFTIT